ncbi:MAG: DUF2975 domain-containing protein [Lacipirellulaceae bacterium]
MDHVPAKERPAESLRWSAAILFALIGLGSAVNAVNVAVAAAGWDFLVTVSSVSGPVVLGAESFQTAERLALVAITASPCFCWIIGLLQLTPIAVTVWRGELLTTTVVRCMRRFGWSLLAMSVASALVLPLAGGLLVYLGKCDPLKDVLWSVLTGDFWDTLLAGCLVLVISHLLRIGLEARDEAQWTV